MIESFLFQQSSILLISSIKTSKSILPLRRNCQVLEHVGVTSLLEDLLAEDLSLLVNLVD